MGAAFRNVTGATYHKSHDVPAHASPNYVTFVVGGTCLHLRHLHSLDFGFLHPCDPRESSIITSVGYENRVKPRFWEAVQGDDRGGGRELSMVVFEASVGDERPASLFELRRGRLCSLAGSRTKPGGPPGTRTRRETAARGRCRDGRVDGGRLTTTRRIRRDAAAKGREQPGTTGLKVYALRH